jgi:hypothetical protein
MDWRNRNFIGEFQVELIEWVQKEKKKMSKVHEGNEFSIGLGLRFYLLIKTKAHLEK